ncbi:MAG: hypothetical protein IPH44_02450 [Myxococcales bacterium]|nr:hypothetical protein [Myxococcales bacterium]
MAIGSGSIATGGGKVGGTARSAAGGGGGGGGIVPRCRGGGGVVGRPARRRRRRRRGGRGRRLLERRQLDRGVAGRQRLEVGEAERGADRLEGLERLERLERLDRLGDHAVGQRQRRGRGDRLGDRGLDLDLDRRLDDRRLHHRRDRRRRRRRRRARERGLGGLDRHRVGQRRERRVGLGVDQVVEAGRRVHGVGALVEVVAVAEIERGAVDLVDQHVVVDRHLVDLDRDRQLAVAGQLAQPEQVVELAEQLGGREPALVEVLVGVDLELAVRRERVDRDAAGDQHHRQVGGHALLGLVERRVALLVGFVDGDHHRDHAELGDLGQRVGGGVLHDLEPVGPQLAAEQGVELAVRIDKQDLALAHGAKIKLYPLPRGRARRDANVS